MYATASTLTDVEHVCHVQTCLLHAAPASSISTVYTKAHSMTSCPWRSHQTDKWYFCSKFVKEPCQKALSSCYLNLSSAHFSLNKVKEAKHVCRKLYADEKAKLLARRTSKDQAKSASAQAGKIKPGVSVFTSRCKPSS